MRLLVIVAAVIGIGVLVWRNVGGYFGEAGTKARQEQMGVLPPKSEPKPAAMEMPAESAKPAVTPIKGEVAEAPVSIGAYVFKSRIAPDPPLVLRGENTMRARVELDAVTNSWVWFATPHQAEQIKALAESYDRSQQEMDLEFCLLLVNEDRIKSFGLSVLYNPGASWLTALALDGDAGSLRLSLNDVAIDIEAGNTQASAKVLQVPVVRALEGLPWSFNVDSEVPVSRSDVINNVVRNSVEYRKVGFGLGGVVRMVGKDVLLDVKQRNGSVTRRPSEQGASPEFASQDLSTVVRLAWWEWSVLGGMQVDRETVIKGWVSDKRQQSSDYLVIFVRPRLSLSAPPKAIPVGSSRRANDREMHPLLPVRGWKDSPDGKPTVGLPLPEK